MSREKHRFDQGKVLILNISYTDLGIYMLLNISGRVINRCRNIGEEMQLCNIVN